MTWKEMYDSLAQDAKKVQIRIDKTYPKAVCFLRKQDHSLRGILMSIKSQLLIINTSFFSMLEMLVK
jgi:hypothetical protein